MENLIYALALILMGITAVMIVYYIFFEIYAARVQASTISSSNLVQRQIARHVKALLADRAQGTAAEIADLGAGTGGMALTVARLCPEAQVLAVEFSPLPYLIGRSRAFLQKLRNVRFVRTDLYTLDLRGLDVIITYLPQSHMVRLLEKLMREPAVKPQVWISHYFFLPPAVRAADEIISVGRWYHRKIYIYRLA